MKATDSKVSLLKVAEDIPSLFLAAGDFLMLRPDGTPLGVIRKFSADEAEEIAERFGLGRTTPKLTLIHGGAA